MKYFPETYALVRAMKARGNQLGLIREWRHRVLSRGLQTAVQVLEKGE